MKRIELYECEKCGFKHQDEQDCKDCEASHFGVGQIVDIDYYPGSIYPSRILVKAPDGEHRVYSVEELGEDSPEVTWTIRMNRKRGLV